MPECILNKLKSIVTLGKEKHDVPLPENESAQPEKIIGLTPPQKPGEFREGAF